MKLVILVCLLNCVTALNLLEDYMIGSILGIFPHNPDADRDTCQIVTARGFACETHLVTTNQGYKVELHRVLNPNGSAKSHLYPIILQPGLIGTSSDFVMASDQVFMNLNVTGQNMGFELSKLGYDVWLSNNRGSKYGLSHVSLSPKDDKFWEFSFDQISEFDTPAIIDYILKATSSSKVAFIGHSQGTAIMFALLSQSSKYNDVVKPFIAISPITRIGNAKTSFRLIISLLRLYLEFKGGPVFSKNLILDKLNLLACSTPTIPEFMCKLVFFSIVGPDSRELNSSRLAVYTQHMPTSTSARNLLHFDQLFNTNRFQRFDFGKSKNREIYHQDSPPEYDLANTTHNSIHVIYSRNDWFVPISGVEQLRKDLPVPTEFFEISDSMANHMDPLIGINVAVEVNKKVSDILNLYN